LVVDDRSTDGTREWLEANFPRGPRGGSMVDLDHNGNLVFAAGPTPPSVSIPPIFHERNRGKGGALQTAFAAISGDLLVIQDAISNTIPPTGRRCSISSRCARLRTWFMARASTAARTARRITITISAIA
jgi:hypothetical protein